MALKTHKNPREDHLIVVTIQHCLHENSKSDTDTHTGFVPTKTKLHGQYKRNRKDRIIKLYYDHIILQGVCKLYIRYSQLKTNNIHIPAHVLSTMQRHTGSMETEVIVRVVHGLSK